MTVMADEYDYKLPESILITGGTGYLGQALTRHWLLRPDVEKICIYSRNEAAQARMRETLSLTHDISKLRFFIGDVRDKPRLVRAMQSCDAVIHAAALKRVEVGEYNPTEMMKTNVLGAMNVVEAAREAQVSNCILVSSDKACQPLNAYGASKLCAEKIFLGAHDEDPHDPTAFAVVRYGNVAGSTGSVIPVWREQIARGAESVRVTNPQCRRFYMSVGEAVDLIEWTLTNMEGGETVVPILPAYQLSALAEAMGVPMDVVGITPGEKLDETMIAPYEMPQFRLFPDPRYLVRGGIASRFHAANWSIEVEELTAEKLRTRLKEVV